MADLIKYFFPIIIELFIELRTPLAQAALVNTTLEEMNNFCDLCDCRLETARLFALLVCFDWGGVMLSNSTEELVQETASSLSTDRIAWLLRLVNKSYSPAARGFLRGTTAPIAACASFMASLRVG
jgi:hypothetical protein